MGTVLRRALFFLTALVILAALGAAPPLPRSRPKPSARAAAPALDDCRRALHVLNRLGFGARPGDVERVLAVGIPAYIESQLHPEALADPESDARLDGYPTLRMDEAQLMLAFDRPERDARRLLEAEKKASSAAEAGMESTAAAEAAEKQLRDRLAEIVTAARRPQRPLEELTNARIARAVHSERQLNEVLVDFWMNHFNVFAGKDTDRVLVSAFENAVVRPRIWGCFRDLLLATARSPAMLVYLDNAQSVADPDHRPGFLPAASGAKPPAGGLNENYARELMELHTLGVDGGYTQLDVTELARILTGWGAARPEDGGGFEFHSRLHDVCAKTFLGRAFPAGGYLAEGEDAIALLATHPSTARRIARELCERFVSDDPPSALVERAAGRFLATDGDLRETVRAIVTSPEFFAESSYRAKVKSPFEYVVSAVRAIGAAADDATAGPELERQISRAGEPLYLCAPPTGYPERGSAWVSTGALLVRWNFALALASNRIAGARIDPGRLLPAGARDRADRAAPVLETALLGGDVSAETRRQIAECVLETPSTSPDGERERIALIAGMLLGSPEFQKK